MATNGPSLQALLDRAAANIAKTGEQFAALRQQFAGFDADGQKAIATAEQLRETLENVQQTCADTKAAVGGVFTDYVGDTEPLEPDRGGPV